MKKPDSFFIVTIIVIGIFLRLVWTSDMEWKTDEKWMYEKAHEVVNTGELPVAGMRSGGGIVNPGMSVAAFAVIAIFTSDPISMNRVVEILNIVALLGFLLFILKKVNTEERSTWLWGLALASISPLAVIFSRKIWAQDILPIITLIIIVSNANRDKRWGAFLWGLFGALIGQIHMSGFFFAAGLFVFTVLHDHFNKIKFRWTYWIAGAILGSITIIPWIAYMMDNPQINRQSIWFIFQFNFYLYWFLDSQGLNIMYSVRKEFMELIKWPFLYGIPTYLVAVAHLFLVVAAFFTLAELWKYMKAGINFVKAKMPFKNIFLNISMTRFYLLSILTGLGIFMTMSATVIHPHYLICAFPFSYIFLAKILEGRKKLLKSIILVQLFITICFLFYVHNHGGVERGDYGKAYRLQISNGEN